MNLASTGALLTAAMLVAATACSSNATTPPASTGPAGTPSEEPAAEEPGATAADYPEAPYGVGVGQVLGNMEFVGYFRKETTGLASTESLATLKLSDVRAQAGEPKYAVIHLSGYWCGICRAAVEDMVSQYPTLATKAIFVDVLVEGATPEDVATKANLNSWVKGLKVPYTVLRDPDGVEFRAKTKIGTTKTAFLVELATMKILAKSTSDYSEVLAKLKSLD